MAFNENLAKRLRHFFRDHDAMEEKEMMGGLAIMIHNKMCVGVFRDELMCRVDPAKFEKLIEEEGCRAMEFGGKVMKGWVLVSDSEIEKAKDLAHWINLALEFNPHAKRSAKPKKR